MDCSLIIVGGDTASESSISIQNSSLGFTITHTELGQPLSYKACLGEPAFSILYGVGEDVPPWHRVLLSLCHTEGTPCTLVTHDRVFQPSGNTFIPSLTWL